MIVRLPFVVPDTGQRAMRNMSLKRGSQPPWPRFHPWRISVPFPIARLVSQAQDMIRTWLGIARSPGRWDASED